MKTTTCVLCGNTIHAWWKTALHPGCPLYRIREFEHDPWNAPPIRRPAP